MNDQVRSWLKTLAGERDGLHAVLLAGRGETVRAAANAAVDILLCEAEGMREKSAPCGQCLSCKWRAASMHPDFHHVTSDTSKARPVIRIDSVRALQEQINKAPQRACRVVWIEDAQDMGKEAQNSLLKVLEDPPPKVVFLLSGQEAGLLPTVRSRCMLLRVGMDQAVFSSETLQLARRLLENMLNGRAGEMAGEFAVLKGDFQTVLQAQTVLLRDMLAAKWDVDALETTGGRWSAVQSQKASAVQLNEMLRLWIQAQKRLRANANPALCADWLCIGAKNILPNMEGGRSS